MIATQKKYSRKSIDLTDGPILTKLIRFAVPLVITNLLQTFYNAADMMIVSMSSEANAVGATGSLTNLLINVFMGFAVGTNILVARYLGAKDHKRVSKTVHTSVLMSLIFGVITATVGLFASRSILSLMGAEGRLLDLATVYTQIYFCGSPFLAATNYLSAIFRAKGDTKTPLVVLSAAGLFNVLLNLLFVLCLGMSVEGVALATLISNLLSAAVLLYLLTKEDDACKFSFSKCKMDKQAFVGIVREGLPAGIQGSIFSFSTLIIQSSIFKVNAMLVPVGSEYAPVVNGTSAMSNIDSFLTAAINAVYQAAITFTSQNFGAKKYKRIYRIILATVFFGVSLAIVGAVIMNVFKDPLLSLYGIEKGVEGSLERIAYDSALTRLAYLSTPLFLLGIMNTSTGILRGLGKNLSSTVISIFGACILRVLWIVFVFEAFPSLSVIYLCFPITWGITAIAQLGTALHTLRKNLAAESN